MRWFRRRAAVPVRSEDAGAVRAHLEAFIASRPGVEAYVEPATNVIPLTVVLVAATGEWTRRRVPDPALLRWLSQGAQIPVYDVHQVGYPRRMREHTARVRRESEGPGATSA